MSDADVIGSYAIHTLPLPEDLGGGFEAFFPQLARGVVGYGPTQQEAVCDLLRAVPDFLEAVAEMGQSLPEPEAPKCWDAFSGKFNVRVPKLLHAKLVCLADEQGVSLNALVQSVLMSGATALEAGQQFGAIEPPLAASGRRPTRAARYPCASDTGYATSVHDGPAHPPATS